MGRKPKTERVASGVVAQHIYSLPRILATALDIYGSKNGIKRREAVIVRVIAEHAGIQRIIEELRTEARRAASLEVWRARKEGRG